MDNVRSNPISEYDFAEEHDDIPEQEDELRELQNRALQRMDPNVVMILSSFNVDRWVLERCARVNLRYSQLSGLNSEDLQLLGVEDEEVRRSMLAEFKSLDPLDQNADSGSQEQEATVVDLIQNQLLSMNMLLAATIIKVGANQSSQSPGVIVNNSFNSPAVVLSMLHKMSFHTESMTELMRQLQNENEMKEKEREMRFQSIKEIACKSLFVASGIIIGFFVAKHLRGGKKFL